MNISPLFLLAAISMTATAAPGWDPPMVILGKLAAIAALVALNAFFVACEFSVVKVRTTQLDALLDEGNLRARFVKHVRAHLDAYLSATQLGVTLASLALGWIGEQSLVTILQPALADGTYLLVRCGNFDCSRARFRRDHLFAHCVWRACAEIHCNFQSVAGGASADAAAWRVLCFV